MCVHAILGVFIINIAMSVVIIGFMAATPIQGSSSRTWKGVVSGWKSSWYISKIIGE